MFHSKVLVLQYIGVEHIIAIKHFLRFTILPRLGKFGIGAIWLHTGKQAAPTIHLQVSKGGIGIFTISETFLQLPGFEIC